MVSLLSREGRGADVTERPRRVKGGVVSTRRLIHVDAPSHSQFGNRTTAIQFDRGERVVVAPGAPATTQGRAAVDARAKRNGRMIAQQGSRIELQHPR